MGKSIIRNYLQFSLLALNLNGIIALIWKYDIFHHNGSFIFNEFYVGERRNNKSMIVKATTADSQRFLRILEQKESGYDLSDRDIHKLKLWPEGVIPYYIDPVSYDKDFRSNLRTSLTEISYLSGIDFRELKTTPKDQNHRYIYFVNRVGTACTHNRFTMDQFTHNGPQKVVLGFNSLSNGDLYPFVLTAAGIPPQNNAPLRDNFITIVRENIITEKLRLFDVLQNAEWLYHDLPYDFESASHFHYHEYTRNGQATIRPKYDVPAPTAQGFTFYDIVKMRRTYNYMTNKEYPIHAESGKPSFMYPQIPKDISSDQGLHFGNPDEYRLGFKLLKDDHKFKTESKSKQIKTEKAIQKVKSKIHNKLIRNSNGSYVDNEDDKKLNQVNDNKIQIDIKDKEKEKNEDQREKHSKFIGFTDDSHVKYEVNHNKFDTGREDKNKESNKKEKGIARPKPNKYLGILGDDPVHEEEEYIPEKQKRAENFERKHGEFSEAIDVYLSESSQEAEYTTEFFRKMRAKISTNNINV